MTDQSIKNSYDETPYPTVPRAQTHPDHLAALGLLFGMKPTPVKQCRVLSLGCADGSNLIPMAYQLPQSEFVGLDLSAKQIANGQAKIEALGLENITLKRMDILDVAETWGQFDYIIAYGVYSWVPPQVQDKILEICRQHLTAHGVAYISYNAYPGWYMHGMVRGMMLYQTRHVSDPATRVEKARAVLDFFTDTVPTLSSNLPTVLEANKLILENMRELLQQQPDEYLLHDHLEKINEPLYLHQFVEHAAVHALQYITDAESSALITNYLPAQFARSVQALAPTRLDLEQFMDFLYMRAFRQSLVCHQNVPLDYDIKAQSLAALYVASPVKAEAEQPDIHSNAEEKFQGPIGTSISSKRPLNKAALLHLAEIWPQAIAVEDLLNVARSRLQASTVAIYSIANRTRDIEILGAILLKGYALNLVELHSYRPNFTLEINDHPADGDYPKASDLARFEAQTGQQVTNQRHEIITLDDDIGVYLLPYLDGQHNRAMLLDVLLNLVKEGTLVVQLPEDSTQLKNILAEAMAQSLYKLGQDALLIT